MSQIAVIGVNEDGTFKTEIKRTPVLITELIHDLPNMCEADIYRALCEIRESAERDARIEQTLAKSLKRHRRHK